MFSLKMEPFAPRMRALLQDYGERLAQPSPFEILLPAWIPTPGDVARWRFRRRWLALIGAIIDARQAKGAAGFGRDLLDLMASDPETGKPVSRRRLADQVATMIAAGHATTAVALFWAFYLLAETPAVQERIAAEAGPLDLAPEGAAEALPHLVYTRAVVQEALRLYPPAYGIFRLARRADEAGGVAVPKGAIVMIAPWLLHRHKRLWDEPDVFDPAACHNVESNTIIERTGHSIETARRSRSDRSGGSVCWWLVRTTRVAPLAFVNSSNASMQLIDMR